MPAMPISTPEDLIPQNQKNLFIVSLPIVSTEFWAINAGIIQGRDGRRKLLTMEPLPNALLLYSGTS